MIHGNDLEWIRGWLHARVFAVREPIDGLAAGTFGAASYVVSDVLIHAFPFVTECDASIGLGNAEVASERGIMVDFEDSGAELRGEHDSSLEGHE